MRTESGCSGPREGGGRSSSQVLRANKHLARAIQTRQRDGAVGPRLDGRRCSCKSTAAASARRSCSGTWQLSSSAENDEFGISWSAKSGSLISELALIDDQDWHWPSALLTRPMAL